MKDIFDFLRSFFDAREAVGTGIARPRNYTEAFPPVILSERSEPKDLKDEVAT